MSILSVQLLVILLCANFVLRPQVFAAHRSGDKPRSTARVRPFSLKQVRLLDGPLKDAARRNQRFLRGLELDRLLHNFRVTAGIPSSATPLGGWESPDTELRGHFVGHYLSACAAMYAGFDDSLLKAKADTIVAELARCQQKARGGYLSAFPEELFDRLESGARVWAPWYTVHKIFQGLLDMYLLAGNPLALDVVKKMARWAKSRTDRLDDVQMQQVLKTEFGGMSESILNLYEVTRDSDHLALAKRFEKREFLDPLSDHVDRLKGLHVNTHIPQVIGAARAYEETGEERYRTISTFFWDQVVRARTYATGGLSNGEHWGSEPYHLSTQLGPSTEESCCSYNMLKLTSHLFSWNPDPRYADYYERTLFNSILPAQDPKTGMLMYYKPLGSGWYKTFGTARNSFWCCTGTGVESFGTLGAAVYFHDERSLYVNLFIPSELHWDDKGLTLRQETEFPRDGRTRLIMHASAPIALRLNIRVPQWSRSGCRVKVNGRAVELSSSPSSYLVLDKTWKNSDTIDVEYQMELRLSPMPDNSTIAAVMFGPLVLAGKLGRVADSLRYGVMGPTGPPEPPPVFVTDNTDIASWVEPAAGHGQSFRVKGVGEPHDVELVPLGELFDERYAVYWNIFRRDQWESIRSEEARLAGSRIDGVAFGDARSETEHDFVGEHVRLDSDSGRNYVTTKDWFSVTMKVRVDRPVSFRVTYLKGDTAEPYAITLDGIPLVGKPATTDRLEGLVGETYDIPFQMTRGRRTVSIAFVCPRFLDGKKLLNCEMFGSK